MYVIAFKSSQKPYSIGFAIICVYGSLAGLQSMGSPVRHDLATKPPPLLKRMRGSAKFYNLSKVIQQINDT